jgi:hypothetical protein
MFKYKLSDKLLDYKNLIEKETGKEIKFTFVDNVGLRGVDASYFYHPDYIDIQVVNNISPEQAEQSLPHEFTHGWLNHKLKYAYIKPKRGLSEKEFFLASLLGTMIEDLIVNKHLQDENFPPLSSGYLPNTKKETRMLRKTKNYFSKSTDPNLTDVDKRNRIITWRYVFAWGFREFLELGLSDKNVLLEFIRALRYAHPAQCQIASQIIKLIQENNIFTREGHYKVIDECIKLWGLTDTVELIFPE